MTVATKKKPEARVELLPIEILKFEVTVRGTTPLITHRFPEKVRKQMLEKQQKKAKVAKEARDPEQEFLDSTYPMPGSMAGVDGAKYGVPAIWFKLVAVAACRYSDGLKMTHTRGAFHVIADDGGLIALKYDSMRMREDPVTIGMGSRDLRFRAEFTNWSVKLRIRYFASVITPSQIINLLQAGGFGCGVGEMRPSQGCSDTYGMFEVEMK